MKLRIVFFITISLGLLFFSGVFTGYSIAVPGFIPSGARDIIVTNLSDGYSYEYLVGGEWRKAMVFLNDSGNCMSVSEGVSDLRFYRIVNGSRVDVTNDESYNVRFLDSDGNGLIDGLCWSIP